MLRLGAAVPEAAVDEDGDLFFAEDEVGFAEEAGVSAPAGQRVCFEEGDQAEFGVLVAAAADMRHDQTTLLRCEYVGRHVLGESKDYSTRQERPL